MIKKTTYHVFIIWTCFFVIDLFCADLTTNLSSKTEVFESNNKTEDEIVAPTENVTSLEVPGDDLKQTNPESLDPSPSPPPVLTADTTLTGPEHADTNPLVPKQQVADEDSDNDVDKLEVQTADVPPTAAVVVDENTITDTDSTDEQTDTNATDTESDLQPKDITPPDTLPKLVEEEPQEQIPRPCFPSENPSLQPTKPIPAVSKADTPGNATQSPGGVDAEAPIVESIDVREVSDGTQDAAQTGEGQTPDQVEDAETAGVKEQKEKATPTEQKDITEKPEKDELTDGLDTPEQTITVEGEEDGQTEEEEKEKTVVIKAPPDKDMPSFDEWKKKMLAEQAEQEKTKQQEVQSSQSGTNGQAKVKTSKNRINYAAATCGSKVLSTNTEAKNQGSILTENKDQYMINPCHAKKWFILELCEPMQIQTLEMGNLELFSSVPESFIVQISDRFPAKDWKALGTLHARDERTIQSFSVQDEHMFAKYLKIEMLAHYGSEHYCPLSIIRVFGTTMEEDENDDDDVVMGDPNGELESNGNTEDDEQSNLFTSATNTVISLVKTVLSPGQKDENMEEVVALQGSKGNTSGVNATNATNIDKNQPCSPESSNDTSRTGESDSDSGVPPPCQPSGESAPLSDQLSKCQYCQTGPVTCCPFDRYTLCGYHKTLRFVYRTCCVKPITVGKPTAVDSTPVIEHTVSVQPEIEQPTPTRTLVVETSTSSRELKSTDPDIASLQSSTVETSKLATPEVSPSPTEKPELTLLPRLPAQDTSASIAISVEPSTGHVDLPIASEPTPTTDFPLATEEQTDSQIIISSPLTEVTLPASQSVPSTGSLCDREDVLDKQKNKAACSADRTVAGEIRPSASEAVVMATEVIDDVPKPNEGDTKSVIDEDKGDMDAQENKAAAETKVDNTAADAKPPDPAAGTPQANATTNGMRDIYAEPHSNKDADLDLDTVLPPGDSELLYQKSGKKETTYMRLKNRIKALELNLNLSSRYLEELSQRYKRQMEEMYTSLNKTITKLTKTTVSAERRDEEQQADISVLQDEIRTLKQLVYSLQEDNHSIHTQVVERHLFLMLIEVIIFILIMSFCLRRQRQPRDVKAQVDAIEDVTSVPVKSKPSDTRRRRRRNSIDSTPVRAKSSALLTEKRSRDDIDVIKPGSCHSELTIIEPSLPIFTGHTQPKLQDIPKKKKKKKTQSKNALQTHAASHLTNQRLESQTSNSKLVQSAGVLFASQNGHQENGTNACPQGGALALDQTFSHSAKRLPPGGKNSSRRSLEQSFNGHDLMTSCSWNGVENHPSHSSNMNGISAENIGSSETGMIPKNTSSLATLNGNVSNNIRDGLVINSDPCCRDSTRKARWKWWSPRLALQ